jgi:putative ABC transport system substrate-binding protein
MSAVMRALASTAENLDSLWFTSQGHLPTGRGSPRHVSTFVASYPRAIRDDPMRRREFIAGLAGAATLPVTVRAQPAAVPVIGLLSARSPGSAEIEALRQGLAESGYFEGRNVVIDYRWAEGTFDRLPALAMELVRHRVGVIIATGLTSALAAKAVNATIPMVFMAADDPVKFGLVASLSRPGGNATGLNLLTSEMTTKRLGLVRELLPSIATLAILMNPKSPEAEPQLIDLKGTARAIGQQLQILNASSESEIDAAFAVLPRDAALLVTNDPLFTSRIGQLVALASAHAVPTVYDRRGYVAAGGLMSYGTDYLDGYRKLGSYASKILSGAKPADLPVEQSTRFELIINLKTAKALGIEIPPTLIARADEVIE